MPTNSPVSTTPEDARTVRGRGGVDVRSANQERLSPGIILMAAFTSLHLWAPSNFQSRMKLLLSVTTGP